MNKLAYTNSKGQLCIVYPAPKERLEKVLGTLTDAAYEAHVLDRSVPKDATDCVEVTDDMIPLDRTHRDAWTLKDGKIVIDLDKVVKIDERNAKMDAVKKMLGLENA